MDGTRNSENIPVPIYETQENNNQNQQMTTYNPILTNQNQNPTVLVIERERIIREQVLDNKKK